MLALRPIRPFFVALLAGYLVAIAARIACADDWTDLQERADAVRSSRQLKQAEALFRQLLAVSRQENSPMRIAYSLEMLGRIASDQGKYADAEALFKQSIESWQQGQQFEFAADTLILWADSLYNLSRYDDAKQALLRAKASYQKLPGKHEAQMAKIANDLGSNEWGIGNYQAALEHFKQALEAREKLFGAGDALVAETINNIGFVYDSEGKLAEAEAYFRRGLAIREKALPPNDVSIAWSLNNLAAALAEQGKYADAEPLHERALRIREQVLGLEHPDVAWSLYNLALIYQNQGKFALAENLYQRGLRIREQAYGPVHPEVAMSLSGLANAYDSQGSFDTAISLRQRALDIFQQRLGPTHANVAMAMNNLAVSYVDQDQFQLAAPLYEKALAIHEQNSGENSSEVASTLNNLARVHKLQKKFTEAQPLLERAVRIYEKSATLDHSELARSLNNLAAVHLDQQQFSEALPLVDRAISILEKENPTARLLPYCYQIRAEIAWESGKKDQGLADLRHAVELVDALRSSISGAEKDRADFLSSNYEIFDRLVRWQFELGHFDASHAAAESSRARTLLDQMNLQGADLLAKLPADQARRLKDREASAVAKVLGLEKDLELLPARRDLDEAQKQSAASQLVSQLAGARQEQVDAYRAIRSASPAYQLLVGQDFQPTPLAQLQKWVDDEHALLLQYYLSDEVGYLFIIADGAAPKVVPLSIAAADAAKLGIDAGPVTAKQIKAALTIDGQELPQKLASPGENAAVSNRLAALWQFLIPESERTGLVSGKYQRLIVVPDGALVNLPFDALILETGDDPVYLLDRGPPTIAGPSSTLLYNLVRRESSDAAASDQQQVLTVGDPVYAPRTNSAVSPAPSRQVNRRSGAEILSQFKPATRFAARGSLQPLPYTGNEVSWVAEMFNKIGYATEKLVRGDATEARLRTAVAGHAVVHLACHGLVDNDHGNFFGALALTPGSRGSANPADDGFLTLPEIYDLNLKDCQLAILSACQTNYGPQQRGEGVWALSRGFLAAGSRRVMASNWLVDDAASASLVSAFCSVLVKQRQADQPIDYAAALHEAKRWVRKQPKWKQPYYWGAFVLVGPG